MYTFQQRDTVNLSHHCTSLHIKDLVPITRVLNPKMMVKSQSSDFLVNFFITKSSLEHRDHLKPFLLWFELDFSTLCVKDE